MKTLEMNIPSLNTAAICERLKQVRVQVCGTRGQSHFASLLMLSPSTYNYYEKGRIPPVDVLDRAARVTGAPLLWLIRGEPGDFSLESLKKIDPPISTEPTAAPVASNGAPV
jgi:transcriptional regulator with XRE-family HTH domain